MSLPESDSGKALTQRIAALPPEARRLLELRLGKEGLKVEASREIPVAPRAQHYPLSFGQHRLWFLNELLPGTAAYNIPFAGRLEGSLSLVRLEESFNEVVRRHEILRTRFFRVDGQAVQQVMTEKKAPSSLVDLENLPPSHQDLLLSRLATQEARLPFDFRRAPLVRITLIRLRLDLHVLQVTLPHIVTDAWSMSLIFQELPAIYNAFLEGAPSPLPELPIQVKDHSLWQRQELSQARRESLMSFWKQQLAGAPTILELPADHPRPPRQSFEGRRYPLPITDHLASQVEAFHRRLGVTAYMVYLATYGTLLHRITGQRELLVGSPVVVREPPVTQQLIGFFINTIALRLDLSGRPSFQELLRRVREVCLAAFDHQDLPFQELVDLLWKDRSLTRAPLTQVSFVLQNVHIAQPQLRGLKLTQIQQTPTLTARDDLLLGLFETEGSPQGWLEYNTDIFDPTTAQRLAEQFLCLLGTALEKPQHPLDQLPLISPAQRAQLLWEWNDTALAYPKPATIPALLERFFQQRPDTVALEGKGQEVTYRQLDQRSEALAVRLRCLGVTSEVVVPLMLESGPDLVVAMLAVLKAGGAYLPLDPQEPESRLGNLLAEAWRHRAPHSPTVVITGTEGLPGKLLQHPPAEVLATLGPQGLVVLPGEQEAAISTSPQDPADAELSEPSAVAMGLAYVLFTSGSTGQPKAVAVSHHAVVRLVLGLGMPFGPREVFLQLAPPAFDASTFEIWCCLAHGGKLVFPGRRASTPRQIEDQVRSQGVTTLWLTTALFHLLVQEQSPALAAVERIFTGGETMQPEVLRRGIELAGVPIVHCYGPTEATTFTTTRTFRRSSQVGHRASIGGPLGGTRVFVLGRCLEVQPSGAPGQLWISGDALARGYLGQGATTAERFIPDPFSTSAGSRLYRSGDQARWLPRGELEFLGRLDRQVKIRGFRVEPAEVIAAMLSLPEVTAAEVLARTDLPEAPGRPRLVVYYTHRGEELEAGRLRNHLSQLLPEAFLPSYYVPLEALPLKLNGKVDRDALPTPFVPIADSPEIAKTGETEIERRLGAIWAKLLSRDSIGLQENLFEIGGDSILAIQALCRAAEEGIHLEVEDVFNHPTIAGLATVVREAESRADLPPAKPGPVPLTPLQAWFTQRCGPRPNHWNLGLWCAVVEPVELRLLERAAARLVAHHEALQLRLYSAGDEWFQELLHEPPEPLVERFELARVSQEQRSASLAEASARLNRSLDLETGRHLALGLVDLGPEEPQRLLLVVHHAVADTVSCALLVEQLGRFYGAVEQDRRQTQTSRPAGFAAWARRIAATARETDLEALAQLWEPPPETSPATLPEGETGGDPGTEKDSETVLIRLGAALTTSLLEGAPEAYGCRPEEILLTALAETLGAEDEIWPVVLEGHGRDGPEATSIGGSVGWFTALYPVYLDLRQKQGPGARLLAVKETVRQARQRPLGTAGFGLARRFAETTLELPQGVSFNYLGRLDGMLSGSQRFRVLEERVDPLRDGDGHRSQHLEITIFGYGGELTAAWTFCRRSSDATAVERWGEAFRGRLQALVDHCLDPSAGAYSPADFPQVELGEAELQKVLEQLGEDAEGDG